MLRRLIIGLLVIGASLSLSAALPAGTVAHLSAAQDPAKITVYITRTGEKYHRDGCRYLSRSKIATTLKDAVARGLGPCSVCKPPTIRKPYGHATSTSRTRPPVSAIALALGAVLHFY